MERFRKFRAELRGKSRPLAILVCALALAGCATSRNVRTSAEATASPEAQRYVVVATKTPAGAKEIGQITAARCHRNTFDPVPTEQQVIEDLQGEAYAKGANGISQVKVEKTGMTFASNCWQLLKGSATAFSNPGGPMTPADAQQTYDSKYAEWKQQYAAGTLSLLQFSRNTQQLVDELFPDAVHAHAFLTYRVFAAKQLEDKKIGKEEYDYLVAEKFAAYKDAVNRERRAAESSAVARAQAAQQPDPTPYLMYALGQASASMQNAANAYRPVNCTSTSLGGVVNTSCY